VAALVAAGVLLRPGSPTVPQAPPSSSGIGGPGSSSSAGASAEGPGPWIASCNYWAPLRRPPDHSQKAPRVRSIIDALDSGVRLHMDLDETNQEQLLACGSGEPTRWGFPKDGPQIDVTAIIATVPDPVHSHAAMAFDRMIDAILQAGADNGYVSSYYWLPWKNRVGALKAAESEGDAEPGHDPERERKPGLIILKQGIRGGSFYRVVYLFLVAETPTQGIDGFQFQNALLYEAQLKLALSGNGDRFARGRDGRVAIVGPTYSGAAASLGAAIAAAQGDRSDLSRTQFEVSGATSTDQPVLREAPNVHYLSFQDNNDYDVRTFVSRLNRSGYDSQSVLALALLIEDNTTLGNLVLGNVHEPQKGAVSKDQRKTTHTVAVPVDLSRVQMIRFPREISLLRNAELTGDQSGSQGAPSVSPPSPYLHLSLRDSSTQDSVPQFSRENTPLSQEAELMAISRQIDRLHAQFVGIAASNVLDEIFLAQFLHRACPDARLVFFGGDLLLVREIDNVPFIGSITITPYPLISLGGTAGGPDFRPFASSMSQAHYNSFSYTLREKSSWQVVSVDSDGPAHRAGLKLGDEISLLDTSANSQGVVKVGYLRDGRQQTTLLKIDDHGRFGATFAQPRLQGYRSPLSPPGALQPALWLTAIGRDGYYPLAILSTCASDNPSILPTISPASDRDGNAGEQSCEPREIPKHQKLGSSIVYPSRLWWVSLVLVCLLCVAHTLLLLAADYWSPFTHDLAISDNDEPWRRSTYIQVATAMLFSMAFVIAFPEISLSLVVNVSPDSYCASVVALLAGVFAIAAAIWRTRKYIGRGASARFSNVYLFLSLVAWTTLLAVPFVWGYVCLEESSGGAVGSAYLVGACFAYRCIHTGSGVSPVVPVLLLLFGWYLWAFFQTCCLRFTLEGRPRLPEKIDHELGGHLFISDGELNRSKTSRDSCLYSNLTCLFTTRDLLRRFWSARGIGPVTFDVLLVAVYAVAFVWLSLFTPVRSLDRLLWNTGDFLSSPYEAVVGALFFPLIAISLSGWIRMVLIWTSLKRAVLDRLESLPLRTAFSRLKAVGWLNMLRDSGVQAQRRSMARCLESMRQMLHQPGLRDLAAPDGRTLEKINADALEQVALLRTRRAQPASERDPKTHEYVLMNGLEVEFAAFSTGLLSAVLIPYWMNVRTGPVESDDIEDLPIKARRSEAHAEDQSLPLELHAGQTPEKSQEVVVAEEFLALRYLSLIRAVLANMRSLMMFISVSFILMIMAWNSYPFQPRQTLNWCFTGLLVFLGSGIIWVFAQMHRNAILSRITDTRANELGWDFYLRIIAFGALPVLTWLAYEFPEIGSVVFKFLQPGVPVIK
jgi:hypothetical protein